MAAGNRDSKDRQREIVEWTRDSALRRQGVESDSNGINFELGSREAFGSGAWVEGCGPELEHWYGRVYNTSKSS